MTNIKTTAGLQSLNEKELKMVAGGGGEGGCICSFNFPYASPTPPAENNEECVYICCELFGADNAYYYIESTEENIRTECKKGSKITDWFKKLLEIPKNFIGPTICSNNCDVYVSI